jgi:hypothetical protein
MSLSQPALVLQRRVQNRLVFGLWMLTKLPAAFFCGVRLRSVDHERCVTTVPYGWRSQNPFRSTYFAAQAMAAEMSTGALVLLAAEDTGIPFSTLILDIRGTFGKKATGLATFTCEGGPAVFAAMQEAKATGEARTVALDTVGRLPDGAEVSRFTFTWSVKAKARR